MIKPIKNTSIPPAKAVASLSVLENISVSATLENESVMKMKKHLILLLSLIIASASFADVANGDFSVDSVADASSINVANHLDIGWSAHAASEYDLQYEDMDSPFTAESWFGQIFTDNGATYGAATLEFDISYFNDITSAMFSYAIYGTDSTDEAATSLSLNTDGNPLGPGTAWTLLDSGSMSVTGTSENHQENFNMSTAYDYIAIRFSFDVSGSTTRDSGIAADNISVVPEPATIGLLGIGGALMLVTSRIHRRKKKR